MFRTPSGQTGSDAYAYEAAQIANSLRELNARASRLSQAMAEEIPAGVEIRISIATQRFPDAFLVTQQPSLGRMLAINSSARDAEYLGEIAHAIAHPEYVVTH